MMKEPIIEKLKKHIDMLLKVYVGGESYFDKLDDFIKNNPMLWHLLMDRADTEFFDGAIFSGEFGGCIVNTDMYFNTETDLIVQGGLRKGISINLEYCKNKIKGKKFIFFDDSFYSGKTRNVVKKEIERLGGRLMLTAVVYDGSREKQNDVVSLFRYYDHYSKA